MHMTPICLSLLLLFTSFAGTSVFAQSTAIGHDSITTPIERIIVFGDSLQDTGNLKKVNAGVAPAWAHYHDGRFTDDLVASEYLKARLEAQSKQKFIYVNNAYGGALLKGNRVSVPTSDGRPFQIPSTLQQIETFGRFNDTDLVVVDGGGNNLLFLHVDKSCIDLNLKPGATLFERFQQDTEHKACPDDTVDQYLTLDGIHPTKPIQQYVGEVMFNLLAENGLVAKAGSAPLTPASLKNAEYMSGALLATAIPFEMASGAIRNTVTRG